MFSCIFGHDYKSFSHKHYIDTSFIGMKFTPTARPITTGAKSTRINFICLRCGKVKTKEYFGDGHFPEDVIERIKP